MSARGRSEKGHKDGRVIAFLPYPSNSSAIASFWQIKSESRVSAKRCVPSTDRHQSLSFSKSRDAEGREGKHDAPPPTSTPST
jgi:hypothetical protein